MFIYFRVLLLLKNLSTHQTADTTTATIGKMNNNEKRKKKKVIRF